MRIYLHTMAVTITLSILTMGVTKAQGRKTDQFYLLFKKAEKHYYSGRIDLAISELDKLLGLKYTALAKRQQIAEASRLAALCYLLDSRFHKAKRYTELMLENDPFYQVRPDDPLEFVKFINESLILPKFLIGIKGGISLTIVQLMKQHVLLQGTVAEESLYGSEAYSGTPATNFALDFTYSLSKRIAVNTTIGYQSYHYHFSNSNEFTGVKNYSSAVTLGYLEMPITLQLNLLPKKKFSPYIQAGAFGRYNVTALKEINNGGLPIKKRMNEIGYGWAVGSGIHYDLRRYRFNLDARYKQALTLANNPTSRFTSDGVSEFFIYRYFDTIDDLRVHGIDLSVGVQYFFNYKVTKK